MNKLLVIAGPTASGKSALAVKIAESWNGVVINADSMQVYQAVSILTAQPTSLDIDRVPHRLYGFMAPDAVCSAGQWCRLAMDACLLAWQENRLPVLVGGTGLYIRALLEGLSPIPDIPEGIRQATRALFANLGNQAFHEKLAARDPVMAARLDRGNSQRLMRAWEVLDATGRSLADWQADPRQGAIAADSATILLAPPRADLYASCDRRLDSMLAAGALAEVAALAALQLAADRPVMKALGVAEFSAHLRNECDLATALQLAQQATRRYAKRQTTWFRHQIIPQICLTEQLSESLRDEIFSFIRRFLLTGAV